MSIERKFLNEQEQRELVGAIIESFEEFLESKEIVVNNSEKVQSKSASTIYGTDYGNMEEILLQILRDYGVLPDFKEKDNE